MLDLTRCQRPSDSPLAYVSILADFHLLLADTLLFAYYIN